MSPIVYRHGERLPRGVWSSLVLGMSAGAVGWAAIGFLPRVATSYTRLDQLTALTLGAAIGATVIAAREYRQRRSAWLGMIAGVLLGAVGALVGASVLAFIHAPATPRVFAVERLCAWALMAVAMTAGLELFATRRRFQWIGEALTIALVGGTTAGAFFSMPGVSELWQALACVWLGGTLGLAVCGPELWHASAVIELAPEKGRRWNPVLTREWPLHEGMVLELGEAQLGCQAGRVALYPPAGGLVANGHSVREPHFVTQHANVLVGRARYFLQLLRVA